jgi:hypothetical protein
MPKTESATEKANAMRRACGDLSGRARAEVLAKALDVKNNGNGRK